MSDTLTNSLKKFAPLVSECSITYDELAKAKKKKKKMGINASQLVMPPNIYGAMFDIPFNITLENGDDVRIKMSEVDEFKKLYKQEITECKNRKDFIEKIAVIRL